MKAKASAGWRFAPATVFAHVRERLTLTPDGNGHELRPPPREPGRLRPAAVLIGLAAYPKEVRLILTQRTAGLRDHSGQIAFPGGKIEARDQSPAAAALREAHEEIGLDPRHVEPLGYLEPYATHTGFYIVPVVAKVAAPVAFKINPEEVDEAFEVPFAFLMDAANHALHHKEIEGKMRHFHAMPYGARNIWGVTASILRNLYERLYG
jgi:8-oxo-dGTP pyrophosphatase MutT (NUDIX family)